MRGNKTNTILLRIYYIFGVRFLFGFIFNCCCCDGWVRATERWKIGKCEKRRMFFLETFFFFWLWKLRFELFLRFFFLSILWNFFWFSYAGFGNKIFNFTFNTQSNLIIMSFWCHRLLIFTLINPIVKRSRGYIILFVAAAVVEINHQKLNDYKVIQKETYTHEQVQVLLIIIYTHQRYCSSR